MGSNAIILVLLILLLGALVALVYFLLKRGEVARQYERLAARYDILQDRYKGIAGTPAKLEALDQHYKDLAQKYQTIQKRYSGIIDVDAKADEVRRQIQESKNKLSSLTGQYTSAKAVYDRLKQEVALLEENLEDISFGLYKPHYDFETSEDYKRILEDNWEKAKELIRSGSAITCSTEWNVEGDRRKGERMQKQYSKLLLRAFNGECDAAIAKVKWNNVLRMEERIKKAFEAINELGAEMHISMTQVYRDLRLAELRLEFELEEKKHQEAEEQRRIREEMREEERVQREFEKAKQEAEEDAKHYQKALDRARAELATAKGDEVHELNERVKSLENQLRENQEQKRAISQAQLGVRKGKVYIISNIGSFGETVFKIGMSRRLDPMERVRELGDASVPFSFDVHAMIPAEDAPALEAELHQYFDRKRVNAMNPRKEFFNVTIDEIDAFVRQKNLNVEVTKLAEAKEYRQTLALRAQNQLSENLIEPVPATEEFPSQLPVPSESE